jgi:hypothetical protein
LRKYRTLTGADSDGRLRGKLKEVEETNDELNKCNV